MAKYFRYNNNNNGNSDNNNNNQQQQSFAVTTCSERDNCYNYTSLLSLHY